MEMVIGFTVVIFVSLGCLWRKENRMLIAISFSVMLISTACSHNHIASENNQEKDTLQAAKDVSKKEVPMEKVEIETKTEKATPDKIKKAVFETLGFNTSQGEQKIPDVFIDHENHIIIKFKPDANANGNLLSFSIQQDIANILLGIKKCNNLRVNSVQLISSQLVADQSGKTIQKEILDVTYRDETINKIDFESMNTDNMLSMADTVSYLDPALVRK